MHGTLPTSALHDAYEFFLGQTGHARTALTRMASLNKVLLKHRAKHPRLELWCRFLGLTATGERYPCMLLHAYINSLAYVRSLQRDLVQVEQDGTLWCPLRASERSVERCFSCWVKKDTLEKLLKESSKLAVVNISMEQKAVPFDAYIAPMMRAALNAMVMASQTLKVLFWATDCRVDGQLSLRECKEMVAQVVQVMDGGGSFHKNAPTHAVSGDGSTKELLAVYRRLGLESDEHGSISEVAWVRTAFETGLIPTHDAGGRPFQRAASNAWTSMRGPLERVQGLLSRLERKQSDMLQAGDSSADVDEIDKQVKDWSKRRDRVETILGKKIPAHGGRESGISAVRAVRALALRINKTEGRVLSVEESGLLLQDQEMAAGGDILSVVPRQALEPAPALPDVNWGSDAAREVFEELQLEKSHVLGQLTMLRMEADELVEKQVGFNLQRDKLKTEIADLRKIVMRYTLGDIEAESQAKDQTITELTVALEEAEEKLQAMDDLKELAAKKGIKLGAKLRGVKKASMLLGAHRVARGEAAEGAPELEPEALSDGTAGTAGLLTPAQQQVMEAEKAEMENEIHRLRAQLAEIATASPGKAGPGELSDSRKLISPIPSKAGDGEREEGDMDAEHAVCRMVDMLRAVGQVTGLDNPVRRPGFALASAAPTRDSTGARRRRPASAQVRNSSDDQGFSVSNSLSSTGLQSATIRTRPASASAVGKQARSEASESGLVSQWHTPGQQDRSAGCYDKQLRATSAAEIKVFDKTMARTGARSAMANVLKEPGLGLASAVAKVPDLSLSGSSPGTARQGTRAVRTRPSSAGVAVRTRPSSASVGGRPRLMRSLAGVAVPGVATVPEEAATKQRPGSARPAGRPNTKAELVW